MIWIALIWFAAVIVSLIADMIKFPFWKHNKRNMVMIWAVMTLLVAAYIYGTPTGYDVIYLVYFTMFAHSVYMLITDTGMALRMGEPIYYVGRTAWWDKQVRKVTGDNTLLMWIYLILKGIYVYCSIDLLLN